MKITVLLFIFTFQYCPVFNPNDKKTVLYNLKKMWPTQFRGINIQIMQLTVNHVIVLLANHTDVT